MEYFSAVLSAEESNRMVSRIEAHFEERGFGLWAIEIPNVTSFAGFIGLTVARCEARFTPCVEIGWRLAAGHWGRGYASEAARAALEHGFVTLGLDEIVSFTALPNLRSQAVMRRIGMHDRGEMFEHPGVAPGHPLRPHCLYRLARREWEAGQAA